MGETIETPWLGQGASPAEVLRPARSVAQSPGAPSPQALSPDVPPTDTDLVAGCLRGDPAAWSILVARYERLVFSTALHQGLAREDAADVTQMAFVALLDGLEGLREHESLPFWLMTVARRQAWRLSRRQSIESPVPAPRRPAEQSVDPSIQWEEVAALHKALGRLRPQCRDLLYALYLDPAEPTYAEVARRMNRPVGSIGPMRGRCLEHLRGLLDAELT